MPTLKQRCTELLIELGIATADQAVEASPLTGGVASDIAMVSVGGRKLCVKFALPKLKVQADWFAPLHRNATEYAWLQACARVAPESAITLYGQSHKLHGFAMEFLDDNNSYLWKTRLLCESPDQGEAARVGDLLGRIHAASAQRDFSRHAFQNSDDFHALRIEPYILYTASVHQDIAATLRQIATQLLNTQQVLVHGDTSPKNIFIRSSGPVILDAECATMGDASFDPTFCLNHLVLKAIHLSNCTEPYLQYAMQFWRAYRRSVTWEPATALESRICRLLPVLMLARVDGKSPVEYLSAPQRNLVRHIARQLIIQPVDQLDILLHRIIEFTQGETP